MGGLWNAIRGFFTRERLKRLVTFAWVRDLWTRWRTRGAPIEELAEQIVEADAERGYPSLEEPQFESLRGPPEEEAEPLIGPRLLAPMTGTGMYWSHGYWRPGYWSKGYWPGILGGTTSATIQPQRISIRMGIGL